MTAVRVQFEVTSEHPCQIPIIGEFAAGETKVIDDYTLELFEVNYGYKLGASSFARSITCVARVIEDSEPVKDEEVTNA